MTYITMSQAELDQVEIFAQLKAGTISQGTAAGAVGITSRQVRRKLKDYRKRGAIALVHAGRGKPSNHQLGAGVKDKATNLVREKYPDFAPTLAAEKLLELDDLKIGKETLRLAMIEAGIWRAKSKAQAEVHSWRPRRSCIGELIQLDGSYHHWFENRGEECCLLAFIDDATSQLLWAEFCSGESTSNLFAATKQYLEALGRPLNLYTDRGGVYKVNLNNPEDNMLTQYERALKELSIGLIHARSPQAKGRVERLFETLQDRLVKELRLAGISTIQEANQFLRATYLPKHNAKFAVIPKEAANLHRSLEGYDLARILCCKEQRSLQADWCLSYQNRWLQLEKRQLVILAKKDRITVSALLDGSLELSYRGKSLAFQEISERPSKPIKEKQPDRRHIGHVPPADHPWRVKVAYI